jgi:hypothetical protein
MSTSLYSLDFISRVAIGRGGRLSGQRSDCARRSSPRVSILNVEQETVIASLPP